MAKKIVSFIIILLAYSIIGTVVLMVKNSNSVTESREIKTAFALDRTGDIYYISVDANYAHEKHLSAVDSTGKNLFDKTLSEEQFGAGFFIDSIYVEYNKNIYVTAYNYDHVSGKITRASVHSFNEDGSYARLVFSEDVKIDPNAFSHIISAFSEDDDNIYFAILSGGNARIISASKNGSDNKIEKISVEGDVYGFAALSANSIAVGTENGLTVYTPDGRHDIRGYEDAIFDRFWNGIDSFYVMDSASGSIYLVSQDYFVVNVLSGSKTVNNENGSLTAAQMDDIAVGITGNIMGTVRGEPYRVFTGSFTQLSEITVNEDSFIDLINRFLIYIVVAAAVILLTVLTWDFYCSILKMRLSIMLRQSLLVIMSIMTLMFWLVLFVISPQVINIVRDNIIHETDIIANIFEAEIANASNGDGASDYSAYTKLLSDYGRAESNIIDYFQTPQKPSVSLVEIKNGRPSVIASSDLYPTGYPANMLIYSHNLARALEEDDGVLMFLGSMPRGDLQTYVRPIDLPMTDNDTYLMIETESSNINDAMLTVLVYLMIYMPLGGVALAVMFIIIESITVRAVKKLKRSVDKIALGEYNTVIDVRSGDEVEELSVSVKALANHIIEKTTSLEQLNNSYYRFVPQSFLTNLGENQIERVGKSLYAKKDMAVLFLRFSFSQPLSGMEAQDIFSSINSVYERIVPIINANGGTAYNFLFNGLNAIFHESAEGALQAAIRIRETIAAYNEIQRSKNLRTADVRIVISEGEVLLGFIGDDRRMEPSAVSAAINEAEEIEKILTDSGLYIVCTESAFLSLPKDKYRSRMIGSFVTAEGERILYDMFDSDPYTMIKLKEQFMVRFELGVNLFKKQDFTNARNVFMDIVKYAADDGVSRNYMYLSEHNIFAEKKQLTYTVYSD